jgi:hemerythrin
MAMIEWNNDYSVKVKELDEHHKKLIGYINELHDSMKQGKGNEVISKIVNDLIEYSKFHFSAEEKYMEKYNYPDSMKHKEEHSYFINKALEFKKAVDDKTNLVSIKVMGFLVDWLLNHIANTDKKYSKTFNDNGLL